MKNIALSIALLLSIAAVNESTASIKVERKSVTDTTKTPNYVVFGKSSNIASVEIRKIKKPGNIVYITVGNKSSSLGNNNSTAIGLQGKSESKEARNATGPTFDQIEVLNGGYDEIKVDKLSTTQNIYTIKNINFPLRLKMQSGKDYVEFEIKETGRWDVNVNYKNN